MTLFVFFTLLSVIHFFVMVNTLSESEFVDVLKVLGCVVSVVGITTTICYWVMK
jgi:hypothetical protein